jgi:hypothetical protein
MKNKLLILIFIVTFCVLFLLYFYENTNYFSVNVPTPLSDLPNGKEWRELYILQNFVDEYGKVLILRKEGRAHGTFGSYSFDTLENTLRYFDDHITRQNWIRSTVDPIYQCQYGLPEKKYATPIIFQEYIKSGDDPEKATRKICVAIIALERLTWESEDTFEVILISLRYSPFTEFLEAFRDW